MRIVRVFAIVVFLFLALLEIGDFLGNLAIISNSKLLAETASAFNISTAREVRRLLFLIPASGLIGAGALATTAALLFHLPWARIGSVLTAEATFVLGAFHLFTTLVLLKSPTGLVGVLHLALAGAGLLFGILATRQPQESAVTNATY